MCCVVYTVSGTVKGNWFSLKQKPYEFLSNSCSQILHLLSVEISEEIKIYMDFPEYVYPTRILATKEVLIPPHTHTQKKN